MLRENLPELPERIARLPVSKGYPVPYFVQYFDGVPDFRAADTEKLVKCVKENRCWICGDTLGAYKTFVIGPMATMNGISSEPPMHRECAEFALRACPHLLHPQAKRREGGLPEERQAAGGILATHNPGVMVAWTTKSWKRRNDGRGGILFFPDAPTSLEWWTRGRLATRAEAEQGLALSVEKMRAMAEREGPAALHYLDAVMVPAGRAHLPKQ